MVRPPPTARCAQNPGSSLHRRVGALKPGDEWLPARLVLRTCFCVQHGIAASQGRVSMPKIENPHLATFELVDEHTVRFSQSEYELSPDEWYRRRTEAFAQLRKAGGIPGQLLDLVERFKEQTLVQPFVYRPEKKVELRFGVKVLGKREDNEQKEGMTASETLALMLRSVVVHSVISHRSFL